MKVFVEFVGSVFFVDLKLSQNPFMPTTHVYCVCRYRLGVATEIVT